MEQYIKNFLNADLPKIPQKIPPKAKEESLFCTISDLGEYSHISEESSFFEKDELLINSLEIPSLQKNTFLSINEDQLANLEVELATCKINLQN